MSTFSYPITAILSSDNTGKASNLLTTAVDSSSTTRSLGSLTWSEETDYSGSTNTGAYIASGTFDTSWSYPIIVKVAVSGTAGVISIQQVFPPQITSSQVASAVLSNPSNLLHTDASGGVLISGYESGQDPVSLILASSTLKALIAKRFHYTVDLSNPTQTVITVYDTDNTTVLTTITDNLDSNNNILSRDWL